MLTNNIALKSQLEAKELLLLESEVKNQGKSMLVAYILWYFLGIFGGHRFYLDKKGTAITMIILDITIIGLAATIIWHLIDAFMVYRYVKEINAEVESRILAQIMHKKNQSSDSL